MSHRQRVVSKVSSRPRNQSRYPTRETTREDFIDDAQRTKYHVNFRFTQTQQVSGQVDIHELVEFAEDLRWLIKEKYTIPIERWDVGGHDIKITLAELPLNTVNDRRFEADIESLAEEHDIGLCKTNNLYQPTTTDGAVVVNYAYGWEDTSKDYIEDQYNPTGNVCWVGGFRGQSDTMEDSSLRIVSVESKPVRNPLISKFLSFSALTKFL